MSHQITKVYTKCKHIKRNEFPIYLYKRLAIAISNAIAIVHSYSTWNGSIPSVLNHFTRDNSLALWIFRSCINAINTLVITYLATLSTFALSAPFLELIKLSKRMSLSLPHHFHSVLINCITENYTVISCAIK